MNEVIEIRTDYDARKYMKFNRFHLFKKNKWIAFLPIVIFIILGLSLIISGDYSGLVFVILALFFPLLMLLIVWIAAKLHLKSNKMFDNMKNIYFRFDNDNVYNEVKSTDITITTELKWNKIYRIYESKDSFYIYISNMQAFIVPKTDIVTGSIQDLKSLINKKVTEEKIKSNLIKR